MSLYVDAAYNRYGRMLMSHLIADTPKELRRAAFELELSNAYIQRRGSPHEHLDICKTKRQIAITKLGAKEISIRELVKRCQDKAREVSK